MKVKSWLDRKLVLMVVSPVARALLSLISGYLSATAVPPEMIDQLASALGVAGVVAFNVAWEYLDRRKVEDKASLTALREAGVYTAPADDVRDRFDRESG